MTTQQIKGNLARLLATENLIVEHRKVSTASFDVERRVLTLPNWDRASNIVYDLLVGHEVGHALFTPNEDWNDRATCPRDYINVVEDARIEKLMKRKFPGLRKSFAGGYTELNEQDFFGIADEDPETFSLIDRINLHFKCGATSLMPFDDEEKVFVTRIDVCETFDEVCQIADDIYAFVKQQKEQQKQEDLPMDAPPSSESGNSSHQEQTPTGDSDESEDTEMEDDAPQSVSDDMDYDPDADEDDEEESKTQQNFDSASNQLTDYSSKSSVYVEIPEKIDIDSIVVDWTEVHAWIDGEYEAGRAGIHSELNEKCDREYREFRQSSQKEVNYLVKEFECRKSADAYARAGQSKTGVLDTSKLHTYKYNEDLFKKVTIMPDGKNHGMLFLLDWSGSMVNQIHSTFKQLLNLTAFCKKVQIPFEVYAFTNEWRIVNHIKENAGELDPTFHFRSVRRHNLTVGEISINPENFNLVNIVSSRSNSKDYERQCKNIWRITSSYDDGTYSYSKIPYGMELSGTPLNDAIVCMNYIIPQFKKQNDLQKVNLLVLTDGDSCMIGYGRRSFDTHTDEEKLYRARVGLNVSLRDRKTGRVYPAFQDAFHNVTNTLIQQVRDRFPEVNVLGFRILSGSHLSNFVHNYGRGYDGYSDLVTRWKKEKSVVIQNPLSYSAIFAIQQNSLESDTDFNVEAGAKKGEISKAFKKMLKSKSTNKKLLSSFVGYIA